MAEAVRAASVGIGWWSGVLADAIKKTPRMEIVTCFTRSPQKRAEFARKYGCREANGFEALLEDPEVEGVLLTTPHSAHGHQIEACARARKHVFVEKPITHNVREAKSAISACERAGVVLSVGHSRRRQGGVRKLKALIEEGALGKPVTAEANLSYGMGFTLTKEKWRSSRVESPAGPLFSFGIHHLDTLSYLLGPIARVSAFSRHLVIPVDIDDATTTILEFESGALGYVGSNFATPRVTYLSLYGTEANAFMEAEGTRLFLQRKGGEEREPVPLDPPVDIILEEMEEFARCVRSGVPPEVGGREALAAVAAVEAIVRSSEEGRAVTLKEILV